MWHQINKNKRQSQIVLFLFLLFFVAFGASIGYLEHSIRKTPGDGVFECIFYSTLALIVYFWILARTYYKKPEDVLWRMYLLSDEYQYKLLYNIVEEMTIAAGLNRMPKIYIVDTMSPNAFAYGLKPDQYFIAVTNGLLQLLNRNELQGVIAHEIAHIANKDTTFLMWASSALLAIYEISHIMIKTQTRRSCSSSSSHSSSGILVLIAAFVVILAPLFAKIFYFFISRKREYLADACAVQYTRYPMGLANALRKIYVENEDYDYIPEFDDDPFVNASCIVPCTGGLEKGILFSTHPATMSRIKILSSMTSADYNSYNNSYCHVMKKGNIINKIDANACAETKIVKPVCEIPITADEVQVVDNDMNIDAFKEKLEKRREIEDVMWRLANYTIIECDCNTKLKIPPSYKGTEITCPHCKKIHMI